MCTSVPRLNLVGALRVVVLNTVHAIAHRVRAHPPEGRTASTTAVVVRLRNGDRIY